MCARTQAKDCLEQGVDDFVVLHDDLANVPEHMFAASWQQDCSTPPARESDRLENLRADGVCASARRAQTEGRQDTGGGVHDAEEAANHRNEVRLASANANDNRRAMLSPAN